METTSIREIIDTVLRGQIRIPAFQRGFVWEADRVAYLMDSIYKDYPFGALLFWRTKEVLKFEKNLGPFKLPKPKEDYPVDYVLDGQQRITSIFAVFQNTLAMPASDTWKDIYFDHQSKDDVQDSQFVALDAVEVDPKRHFPLRALFDTTAYRKVTSSFDESTAKKIDEMQSVFKEVKIPVQIVKNDEKATVAIIFERINRQGVPLDTLQLLSAWTWSEDFQLQNEFAELSEELEQYGLSNEDSEENLMLRCTSAILAHDASPNALINLKGSVVRSRFDEVVNGIKGALDFLEANYGIARIANLPFQTILVPLSVLFSAPKDKEVKLDEKQRTTVNRWFWRVCFSRRYSSGVLRNLAIDIAEMVKLKNSQAHTLGDFAATVEPDFFLTNNFGMGNVNTKTFILVLAAKKPLSFASGTPLNLKEKLKDYNRTEYHHLMPKAFLEASKQADYSPNALANFAFLSRAENRHLGGEAPSKYRAKIVKDAPPVLEAAFCTDLLFKDGYRPFMEERAKALSDFSKKLLG